MVLYAFGSNGSGQLGIGSLADVSSPTKCEIIPLSPNTPENPIRISAGGNHTLFLFSPQNTVAVSGHLTDTSHSVDLPSYNNPLIDTCASHCFPVNHNVRLCSATWEASAIVRTDDSIHTYGTGSKGELGRGFSAEATCWPQSRQPASICPLFASEIVDLASGVQHTVAVLANGEVYGWGDGRKGQLGELMEELETPGKAGKPSFRVYSPRRIEGVGFKVVRAVCGREFTYLVGDPTEGHHLVLGSDKWRVRNDAPDVVPGWKDIGAGWGSIYVLDHAGKVISWGRKDHGQLAPDGLPPIEKIAVGSEHAMALSKDGKVLAWGWGEHGNCGPSVDKDGDVKGKWNEIPIPDEVQGVRVMGISAGCATSWFWTEPRASRSVVNLVNGLHNNSLHDSL